MSPMKHQEGFLLVEVLVGMLILSIGMISSMALHQVNLRGISTARHMTSAAILAQFTMEELLSVPFERLKTGPLEGEKKVDVFTNRWFIRRNQPSVGFMVLEVEVRWEGRGGKVRRMKLMGLRAEGVVR